MLLTDGEWYVDTNNNVLVVKDMGKEFSVYADWAFYTQLGKLISNNEVNQYGDIWRVATTSEVMSGKVKKKNRYNKTVKVDIELVEKMYDLCFAILTDHSVTKGGR